MTSTLGTSPLQLRHLIFTRVQVEALHPVDLSEEHWAPNFDFTGVNLQVGLRLATRQEQDPEPSEFLLDVSVHLDRPEDEKAQIPPYRLDVQVQAWFTLHGDIPAEKRATLVEVNGGSMVIGAIREEVARITARSSLGTLTLPTLRLIPQTDATD